MQVEFPIQCACGLENIAYEKFITNQIIIECECGTRLTTNQDDWLYMSQVQMAMEIRKAKKCYT